MRESERGEREGGSEGGMVMIFIKSDLEATLAKGTLPTGAVYVCLVLSSNGYLVCVCLVLSSSVLWLVLLSGLCVFSSIIEMLSAHNSALMPICSTVFRVRSKAWR